MEYRLNTKKPEKSSVLKGVRHFETRKSAMAYIALKYNILMHYVPEVPGQVRAYYIGERYDEDGSLWEAETPAGEWRDDHDVAGICKDGLLVELVTYADAYTYEFRYEKEYNYIETV